MPEPKIQPGDGDPRHGTANGYGNLYCRCQDCRDANAAHHTAYLNRHPEQRAKNTARGKARYARLAASKPPRPPHAPRHGTLHEYQHYGCRCEQCRTAASEWARRYRATRPPLAPDDPRHGSRAGYSYGCRCQDCRDGAAEAQRLRNQRIAAKMRAMSWEPPGDWQQRLADRFARIA